jgi:hypothetical protein
MPGPSGFLADLQELGYDAELRGENLVISTYEAELGTRMGESFTIGLHVPGDWPMTPPGGPIVAPRILPLNSDQSIPHPYGGVHENNELGVEGHYLSRPFLNWPATDRSVAAYLAHIRHLFDTLPQ